MSHTQEQLSLIEIHRLKTALRESERSRMNRSQNCADLRKEIDRLSNLRCDRDCPARTPVLITAADAAGGD